jgi:fructose-1,6-bisphosphatase/inositol monophosphatase family enzyme
MMSLSRLDIDEVARVVAEVAADEILPRFRTLEAGDIREKEPGDLVTVADVAAEKRLTAELRDLLPGSLVLGEEAAAADPSILDRLKGDAPVWVVDPLDGTANFSSGVAAFVVIVALVLRDRAEAGWIHDPNAGRTAVAVRGQGAHIARTPLRVAAPAPVAEMRGTLHGGRYGDAALLSRIKERRSRVGAISSLRCAGLEYLRLGRGETHFTLFSRLMPWDHAAGVLIHGEAGGTAAYLDGTPYRPSLVAGKRGLLLAPDEASWHSLHRALIDDDRPGADAAQLQAAAIADDHTAASRH